MTIVDSFLKNCKKNCMNCMVSYMIRVCREIWDLFTCISERNPQKPRDHTSVVIVDQIAPLEPSKHSAVDCSCGARQRICHSQVLHESSARRLIPQCAGCDVGQSIASKTQRCQSNVDPAHAIYG